MYKDIAILFGAHGKDAGKDFNQQKELANEVIQRYNVSSQLALFSLVEIGEAPNIALKFTNIHKHRLYSAILKLTNKALQSPIDVLKNIKFVNKFVFTTENGARDGAGREIILFMNDKSKNNDEELNEAVSELDNNNVKITVVPVGKNVDSKEVEKIAVNGNVVDTKDKDLLDNVDNIVNVLKPGKCDIITKYQLPKLQ